MRTVDAVLGKPIELNKTGTNETTVIRFRVRQWLEAYPGCVITLIHRRAEDETGLPVSGFEVDTDAGMGLWTVSNADTAFPGGGECELIMDLGTKKAKSPTYFTMTVQSVGDQSEEPPEPYEGWVDMVVGKAETAEAAAEEAKEAKETILGMRAEAETLFPGSEATAEYDAETGVMHFGIPAGEDGAPGPRGLPGDDGFSPEVTIQTISGGHSVTITDIEHPEGQTFNVMNGAKGDQGFAPVVTVTEIEGGHSVKITDEVHPTGQTFNVMDGEDAEVPIDDTEPAADKVYSSQKVASEVSQLNQAITDLDDDKLDIPTGTPVVGKTIKIKTVNEDGSFVCEWADGGSGGAVTDVQINGTTILDEDGVANIPKASATVNGVLKIGSGLEYVSSVDAVRTRPTRESQIDARNDWFGVLSTPMLNYAVTAALTDAHHLTMTSTQQATAQQVLGLFSAEGVGF